MEKLIATPDCAAAWRSYIELQEAKGNIAFDTFTAMVAMLEYMEGLEEDCGKVQRRHDDNSDYFDCTMREIAKLLERAHRLTEPDPRRPE